LNRPPTDRINPLRRELRKRFEHESPVSKARVRHGQFRPFDDAIAEEDQIQIERPRRAGPRSRSAAGVLDRHQLCEQRIRIERGCADHGRVQIGRLRLRDVERRRLAKARDVEIREKRGKSSDGEFEVLAPVAQVGAQRNRDARV